MQKAYKSLMAAQSNSLSLTNTLNNENMIDIIFILTLTLTSKVKKITCAKFDEPQSTTVGTQI